jgi:hypothetical protein
MRDMLVKVLGEDSFADCSPLSEAVDVELAGKRACCGDDEIFEYSTRHRCRL